MPLADAAEIRASVFARTFRPLEHLTVDRWADAGLTVAYGPLKGEPWRTDLIEIFRESMRDWTDPDARSICWMCGTQMGKTAAMLACLLYGVDRDPFDSMWVTTSKEMAAAFCDERLIPHVEACPEVAAHLVSDKKARVIFDTMLAHLAGANSPGAIASRSAGRMFLDEIDKWPARLSGRGAKEGSALGLARKRMDAYGAEAKEFVSSTPTLEMVGIHREYSHSDRGVCYVPCPRCGGYQRLRFGVDGKGGVRWPAPDGAEGDGRGGVGGDLDDEAHTAFVDLVGRTAWYECQHCRGRIESHERPAMLRGLAWVRSGETIDRDGRLAGERVRTGVRGYHASQLYSAFVTIGEVAAEFVRSRGRPPQEWVNSRLGEPWVEGRVRTGEEDFRRIVQVVVPELPPYGPGIVPGRPVGSESRPTPLVLLGAIDVQQAEVWFVLRGWGEGERSWLIDFGSRPCPEVPGDGADLDDATRATLEQDSWALVEELVNHRWPRAVAASASTPVGDLGHMVLPMYWAIDCNFRTAEVARFAARVGHRAILVRGSTVSSVPPITIGSLDRSDAYGLEEPPEVLTLNTDYWKSELQQRIRRPAAAPGAWYWPTGEGGVPREYVRQMTAEHRVVIEHRRGARYEWQKRPGRDANHAWDCEVYTLAAAEYTGALRVTAATAREPEAPGGGGIRIAGRMG